MKHSPPPRGRADRDDPDSSDSEIERVPRSTRSRANSISSASGTQKMTETQKKESSDKVEMTKVEACYQQLVHYVDNELDPNNKLKVGTKATLKNKIANWAIAQAELEGRLQNLMAENERLWKELDKKQNNPTPISYAQIAKTITPTINNKNTLKVEPPKHTLFISSNKGENVKNMQKKFTTTINPVKDGIKIRNMRATNKMLIIETETKEDLEKIVKNKKLAEDLKMEPPKKRRPLMVFYDIQTSADNDYIQNAIYEQNLKDQITREEFNEGFTLRFKTGPKDKPTVHHVAEVHPRIRHLLLQQYRTYVGFNAIRAKDYLVVPRCIKCQDIGHVAKHCKAEENTCSHCGEQGHNKNECPKKDQPPVCIPCKNRKKECKEKGKDCKTYIMMMERLIQKTDYGI